MAGTRLWVHGTFVVELALLIGAAVYFGGGFPFLYSITHNRDKFQLLADRSGLSLLPQHNDIIGWSERLENIAINAGEYRLFLVDARETSDEMSTTTVMETWLIPLQAAMNRVAARNGFLVSFRYHGALQMHQNSVEKVVDGNSGSDDWGEAIVSSLASKPEKDGNSTDIFLVVDPSCKKTALQVFVSAKESAVVILTRSFASDTFKTQSLATVLAQETLLVGDEETHDLRQGGDVPSTTNEQISTIFPKSSYASSSVRLMLHILDEEYEPHSASSPLRHVEVLAQQTSVLMNRLLDSLEPLQHVTISSQSHVLFQDTTTTTGRWQQRDQDDGAPYFSISSSEVLKLLQQQVDNASTSWMEETGERQIHLWLFVPSPRTTPLYIIDGIQKVSQKQSALRMPHGCFSIVNLDGGDTSACRVGSGNDDDDDCQQFTYHNALVKSISQFRTCLRHTLYGLSSRIDNDGKNEGIRVTWGENGGGELLTKWELDAVRRRWVLSQSRHIAQNLNNTWNIVTTLNPQLTFPQEAGQKFVRAADAFDLGLRHASEGRLEASLEVLQDALRLSQELLAEESIMERPRFGFDHHMAILAPLLMPPVLPMAVGCLREVKRYRRLTTTTTTTTAI